MDKVKRKFYDICEKCKSCKYLKETTGVHCKGCMENKFKNWKPTDLGTDARTPQH